MTRERDCMLPKSCRKNHGTWPKKKQDTHFPSKVDNATPLKKSTFSFEDLSRFDRGSVLLSYLGDCEVLNAQTCNDPRQRWGNILGRGGGSPPASQVAELF